MSKTLTLGGLFGGWYLFNIYFNLCVPLPTTAAPRLRQACQQAFTDP